MRVRPEPWLTPFRKAYEGFSKSLDDIRHLSANKVTDEPLTDEDITNHHNFLNEVNARIDRDNLTMERVMKDEFSRWNDEFYSWMLDTIDSIWEEKGYGGKPKDGKALITGGLGGSGKSTTLEKLKKTDPPLIENLNDWITINPDDMKEEMIARGIFPEIEGVSTAEMAHIMHGVSSELAHLLGERAMSEGHNVIFDVTMGGGPAKQPDGKWGTRATSVVNDITKFGYSDIDALFMDIPTQQSVDNAKARHVRGLEDLRAGRSSEGGRYVPEKIIRTNDYIPGPGAGGQPNPIGFGLIKWTEDGKQKIETPYEERYGTSLQQMQAADAAEAIRAAIFSADKTSADKVDKMLAEFDTRLGLVSNLPDRAADELAILKDEWAFLDPRSSGTLPATRFQSVNAYNFAKAVRGNAFSDWAVFNNSDLDNQKIVESTGKYQTIKSLPGRDRTTGRAMSGPMLEGLSGTGENFNVQRIMAGLEDGTHELASVPTSDANGKYRLHVPMVHSDEQEFSQYIEYDTPQARDAALAQAKKLQDEGFARRAEKVSALSETSEDVRGLANGLVDMPSGDGTAKGNIKARLRAQNRLEPVRLPSGQWGLRDNSTGTIIGEPGPRADIASRREQILNHLYPRL